ncbi:unnamed protein product, partial [Ectocarpus sp. 4 AP-2014]
MTGMGPSHRSQFFFNTPTNIKSYQDHPEQEQQQQQQQQQQQRRRHDGGVIFTHLFSAPLVEQKMAPGGSGCVLVEKVDKLSYEGERDTLHRTLDNAGKRVRFLSEAANTRSFARAVGCRVPPSPPRTGRPGSFGSSLSAGSMSSTSSTSSTSSGGEASAAEGERECRIVHFTGHGVPGELTFEDDSGQLQYVGEAELLSMLLRGRKESGGGGGGGGSGGSRKHLGMPAHAAAAAAAAPAAGGYAGRLGFEGGIGYAPFVDVSESVEPEARLGGGESAPRTGLQLVFLSSCHSQSVAKCFIEAGVRHVIAVRKDSKVLDHKAAEFAKSFYASLLRGDTVRRAFLLGSACLEGSDQPEEGHKFLLLPPEGDHDVPVFEEVPDGQFVDATPLKPPYRCDAVTQYFWGRAVDVQKVVKHMVSGVPCVTITGQKGIGKTQVLLKACAYTRERNVFGEIFFCRLDRAVGGNDACNWLEQGFQLPAGSLVAHNMDGVVAKISQHVRDHLQALREQGSHPSRRAILVLDGCSQPVVMVGEERFFLSRLLSRLVDVLRTEGVTLTTAVTMRAKGPMAPGRVGVPGEKTVVVEPLDARSTAELFVMCCSRNLSVCEMGPSKPEPFTRTEGKADSYESFAKSDIVLALRGHPGCVQDLCRCPRVHEEKGLIVHREKLLREDIPKLQEPYAYPDEPVSRSISIDTPPLVPEEVVQETASDALEVLWSEVQ